MSNPQFANKNYLSRPYKQIIINVYPTLEARLRFQRKGSYGKGLTSSLTMYAYMAFLLEINEYLPKDHKLTDFQLVRCIANEFPTKRTAQVLMEYHSGKTKYNKWNSFAMYRERYNRGRLPQWEGTRTGPISFPYNENGDRCSYNSVALSQKQIDKKLETYGPDRRDSREFDFDTVAMQTRTKKKLGRPTYESFDWCI